MDGKGSQQILQDILGAPLSVPYLISSARKLTLCPCQGSSVNHWLPLCRQSLMLPGYKPYCLRSLGTITSEDPPLDGGNASGTREKSGDCRPVQTL